MMDAHYHFVFDGLQAGPAGYSVVILRSPMGELHVRINPDEGAALAAELAGVSTPRARLVQSMVRLAERLDARLAGVRLYRSGAQVIEAELILERGPEAIDVPVCFGDALALALAQRLPIHGDGLSGGGRARDRGAGDDRRLFELAHRLLTVWPRRAWWDMRQRMSFWCWQRLSRRRGACRVWYNAGTTPRGRRRNGAAVPDSAVRLRRGWAQRHPRELRSRPRSP